MNIVGKDIRWMKRISYFPRSVRIKDAPKRFQKLKSLGLVELDDDDELILTTLGKNVLREKST